MALGVPILKHFRVALRASGSSEYLWSILDIFCSTLLTYKLWGDSYRCHKIYLIEKR